MFINFGDNANLDGMGFSPFAVRQPSHTQSTAHTTHLPSEHCRLCAHPCVAQVVKGDGMKVVDKLHSGYGEGAPSGRGPEQGRIQSEGNRYLKKSFPKLSYINAVRENGKKSDEL